MTSKFKPTGTNQYRADAPDIGSPRMDCRSYWATAFDYQKIEQHLLATEAPGKFSVIGTNAGHGYVWSRPDGLKRKCGGPEVCPQCRRDRVLVVEYGLYCHRRRKYESYVCLYCGEDNTYLDGCHYKICQRCGCDEFEMGYENAIRLLARRLLEKKKQPDLSGRVVVNAQLMVDMGHVMQIQYELQSMHPHVAAKHYLQNSLCDAQKVLFEHLVERNMLPDEASE